VRRFQPRYKPLYRSPRIRREVISLCLRVNHQQIKRHSWIVVEINDADSASLPAAMPTPPDLADATASRDPIAGLGVARYEIDEIKPLVIGPKSAGLANEHSRFRYRNRPRPHLSLCTPLAPIFKIGTAVGVPGGPWWAVPGSLMIHDAP
jgi:hypothetical protein